MKRAGILVILVLTAFTSVAQDRLPDLSLPFPGGAITGQVTTVSGNLIGMLNGTVTVDATGANIHNRRGSATIADVKPGSQLLITLRNPNAPTGTMLQAASILIVDPPAGSLNGPVQSVDVAGSALTIFGARVLVTPATKISGRSGNATFAQIKPGDMVIVELNVTGSALVAESIILVPPVPNASVDGTVKSIGATSWVITTRSGDVTVTVNSSTTIGRDIKVGDSVHVAGTSDASGHITAVAIAAVPKIAPPQDWLVQGTVKSIAATAWVITGRDGRDVTVVVDQNTRIDATLKVGDEAIVIGRPDLSGNVIAIAITRGDSKRRSTRS